jgi:hypothetical protein
MSIFRMSIFQVQCALSRLQGAVVELFPSFELGKGWSFKFEVEQIAQASHANMWQFLVSGQIS